MSVIAPHARAVDVPYTRRSWTNRALPEGDDIKGKTVLDVGCWAGAFCKVAMEKGAKRALGIDICTSPELIKGVEFRQLDFMSEAACQLPQFDYVFLFGVLYHTHNPMGMLMQARRFARQRVYVETAYAADRTGVVIEVFDDHTNWFRPSSRALEWMMQKVGLTPAIIKHLGDDRMMIAGDVEEAPPMYPRGKGWMTK